MVRVPTDFDLQLQSERERWLRRRLLALCAIGAAMALLSDGPKFLHHHNSRGHEAEGWVNFIEATLLIFIYVSAGVYARWNRLKQRALLRLVFWLVISVAIVELICSRAITNFYQLAEPDPRLQAAAALGLTVSEMFVLVFAHLTACLLMPWTARESLRPAVVMLGLYSLALLWDLAMAALPGFAVVTVPVLAVGFIPGTLICLWRYSRFRRIFQLRFESTRYRELQGELASARRLHEASMPKVRSDGPIRLHYVYEPMRQIGGDLLFVHSLAETPHVASVVVLDVTGHGIAAAMTVNRLIGELERQFAYAPDVLPDKVLKDLNRYVALTLARHTIYATALCMKMNAQTGELIWANAGHPPAYIYRANGSFEPLAGTAPILGVDESEEFFDESGQLTMNAGDVLVAYTDGLNEAINPRGDQLGLDGVRRLISESCAGKCETEAWPKQMLEEVLNYRQSPVEDDTLVVAIFGSSKPND